MAALGSQAASMGRSGRWVCAALELEVVVAHGSCMDFVGEKEDMDVKILPEE